MKCPKCGWLLVEKVDQSSAQRLLFCPNGKCGEYFVMEDLK
jgi:predicted RNA-binding Zn ribbon-like protein